MEKQGYVYIMANWSGSVLYTGVTSDLMRRVWEHKNHAKSGFSSRYYLSQLVYYESVQGMDRAIFREKQLKAGPRWRKVQAIEARNPNWVDLAKDW
jgi:putative endonuclease